MDSFFDTTKPIFENENKCFCNRKGVRFHPTEDEIINHFLHHKINGRDSLVDHSITEINLLEWDPQHIPGYLTTSSGCDEKWWYFFNLPDYMYSSNSRRTNRKTKGGFWKVTGKVRLIKGCRGEEIGEKRTLVYYEKSCGLKPTKTNWIIDEFQANTAIPPERNFVFCKLKYKGDQKSGDHDNGIPFPSVRNPIEADAENEETAQAWMDFNHSLSDEKLVVTTSRDNQNQEQACMNFKYSPSDEQLPLTTCFGTQNQENTQALMDFSLGLSDEELMLVTTCFGNQNTALDFQYTWEDDQVDPITMADSFLELDDWPYEEYYA